LPLSLVVVLGQPAGEVLTLDREDVVTVGAAPEADVHVAGPGVGPLQARLVPYASGWELVDASGRGARVNGELVTRAWLAEDDQLALGRMVLRVAEATTAPGVRVEPAELHVLAGVSKGTSYPLGPGLALGRGSAADLPLLDMRCSRRHCRVEHRPYGYVLYDLGSANGTHLNGKKVKSGVCYQLETGDWLQAGRTLLELHTIAGVDRAAAVTPATGDLPAALGRAPTDRVPEQESSSVDRSGVLRESRRLRRAGLALEGELARLGFADLVQFLHAAGKSGELRIQHPIGACGVSLAQGAVTDAWSPYGWGPEETFFALARLARGRFQFVEGCPPRTPRIERDTKALLLEAARLLDEATDVGAL